MRSIIKTESGYVELPIRVLWSRFHLNFLHLKIQLSQYLKLTKNNSPFKIFVKSHHVKFCPYLSDFFISMRRGTNDEKTDLTMYAIHQSILRWSRFHYWFTTEKYKNLGTFITDNWNLGWLAFHHFPLECTIDISKLKPQKINIFKMTTRIKIKLKSFC